MAIYHEGASPKARPILFSAPMIRALIDGQKTQTRRLIKPQPLLVGETFTWPADARESKASWWKEISPDNCMSRFCPYGKPGDLLWCRETWLQMDGQDYYRAQATPDGEEVRKAYGAKWVPSLHMPRRASRLTLELTGVRVERLQDIGYSDALDEGGKSLPLYPLPEGKTLAQCDKENGEAAYRPIWESINGEGSWSLNPFVWVLEFRVHQQNIDALLAERRGA